MRAQKLLTRQDDFDPKLVSALTNQPLFAALLLNPELKKGLFSQVLLSTRSRANGRTPRRAGPRRATPATGVGTASCATTAGSHRCECRLPRHASHHGRAAAHLPSFLLPSFLPSFLCLSNRSTACCQLPCEATSSLNGNGSEFHHCP